jgi:shikimate kinase
MKIFLIGMPGSGKTTLGKELANEMLIPFVDLDQEIEARENKSIPEIFSGQGEDYFRETEAQLLREWAASNKSFIMATGGGAPCFYNGIDIINQAGLSIFIDVDIKEILKRIESNTDRPLLRLFDLEAKETKLNTLLASRIDCYRQARIILQHPDLQKLRTAVGLHLH